MSNVVCLKTYRETKARTRTENWSHLDIWSQLWINYWFALAGIPRK